MNLRSETSELLRNFGIDPDHRWSQNFLVSKNALEKIVAAVFADEFADAKPTVVEVGCGLGTLTVELLKKSIRVIGLEPEQRMTTILRKRFAKEIEDEKLDLREISALDFDPRELSNEPFLLVGNIPYAISGKIFRHFLTAENLPRRAVFLVQKEVAEKVSDKKSSLPKLLFDRVGETRIAAVVSRENFLPVPRVDSAVIACELFVEPKFTDPDEFFRLPAIAFRGKRKKLRGTLKQSGVSNEIFAAAEVDPDARPEKIGVDGWIRLINEFLKKSK